ncbi:MAG: HAMP domain-containing histidine kinase [Spirochaetes bacterium]|nr:HAMP domain-containing histidine kinase [Spirochaetota bacterium]
MAKVNARLHSGSIGIESTPGGGTTVRVALPRQ